MIKRIIGWLQRIFGGKQEYKLGIELVPFKMHGCNVRSRISADQWKRVCSVVHKKARNGYRCQICNGSGKSPKQGFSWPVECHEVWDFNPATGTQKLMAMQSICPMCHKVKHLGLATRQGYGEAALVHLCKVNRIDAACADRLVAHAKDVVKQRSSQEWKLDLTYLNKNDFSFLMIKFTDDEAAKCKNIEF